MAGTFRCTLVTPTDQLLDEAVGAVSLPAHDGQMGVLKLHAPMLVQLGSGLMSATLPSGEKREWLVAGGFAQVKDDVLVVLADEAISPASVSRADAAAALSKALALPTSGEGSAAAKVRQVDKARSMTRFAKA